MKLREEIQKRGQTSTQSTRETTEIAQNNTNTSTITVNGAASDDTAICQAAYQRLVEMGFSNVRILIGGMDEWLGVGYPSQGACKMEYLQK